MSLNKERCSAEFILAMKFLTGRALNMEAIIRTFTLLWKAVSGFKVRNVGDHILLFVYNNKEVVDKILKGESWSFDKNLIVLQTYGNHSPVKGLKFSKVSLWIKLHDIPICFMNRRVVEDLCSMIGEVDKTTNVVEMEGNGFMRVRVTIDVTLTLCQGRIIYLEKGFEDWVTF